MSWPASFAEEFLVAFLDGRLVFFQAFHASLETTQIYTHVSIRDIQIAHRRYHPTARARPKPDAALLREVKAVLKTLNHDQLLQTVAFLEQLKSGAPEAHQPSAGTAAELTAPR